MDYFMGKFDHERIVSLFWHEFIVLKKLKDNCDII